MKHAVRHALRVASVLLALAVVAACETAPVTGRSQLILVSEPQAREMGLQAYQQILDKSTISNREDYKRRVETVSAASPPLAASRTWIGSSP